MHASREVTEIIDTAFSMAQSAHFEYVTPELALYVICQNNVFARAFENCGGSVKELDGQLRTYLDTYMEKIRGDGKCSRTFHGNGKYAGVCMAVGAGQW